MADDDAKPLTADQFEKAIRALKDDILVEAKRTASEEAIRIADERNPPREGWEAAWRLLWLAPRLFSSGLFFIGLGALILWIANRDMQGVHSAFTFVLVVLGVAIVLYGTGTQGMGRMESTTEAGKYNVAMAGGAGVLAFAVALGMIHYHPQMKSAFRIEKNYVRVQFGPGDESSDFTNYGAQFSIDNVHIPSYPSGKGFDVLVPYFGGDLIVGTPLKEPDLSNRTSKSAHEIALRTCNHDDVSIPSGQKFAEKDNKSLIKAIRAQFHPRIGIPTVRQQLPHERTFLIRINRTNMQNWDSSHDFAHYLEQMCVKLPIQKVDPSNTGQTPRETAKDADPLPEPPPAVVFGENF